MSDFTEAETAADALARVLIWRGIPLTDVGDAMLAEALVLLIASRGRHEVSDDLRYVANCLEAPHGD